MSSARAAYISFMNQRGFFESRCPPDPQRGRCQIAITGWKQASDKILASLAGFDHHVAKPYEPAQLIELLSKL